MSDATPFPRLLPGHQTVAVRQLGLLHTSVVHVPTFDALVAELTPHASTITAVDESLLDEAIRKGPTDPDVVLSVERAIVELTERGADSVVCTCSTIGGIAEQVGRRRGLDVVRVDRPMAERAVACGERIVVVAALESTLEPTSALLRDVAAASGRRVEIRLEMLAEAWHLFEAGDLEGYVEVIAAALPAVAQRCDVIVLAQASMAAAADRVEVAVPVLASPRVAVESVLGPD